KTEAQIDEIMNKFLGIDRYIKMDNLPYDVIHHIDMHIKLLDEETLLVGEYPPGVADGPQIEANLQYVINNFQTCFGRPFKVVRIPMPPDQNGQYPPSGQYRTYTNSMFVNKTIIVPTYEYQYDTTALRIYRDAMPGYNVVGINCNSIIGSLGAIHCIMKEVGVPDPVWISHAKMDPEIFEGDSIAISAVIKSKSGIAHASIYWTNDTTLGFASSSMQVVSGDSAVGYIPAQTDSTVIYYYISATSNDGRTVAKPLVAPDGFYNFLVKNSVTDLAETIQPEEFYLFQNYPNPFNPSTKIRFDIPNVIADEMKQSQFISLKVYDMLGNEVATLLNEEKTSGKYEVTFDATGLTSGVYFYKLEAGSIVQLKKMILLK
ncbi:MAG: agmatine deiminase family protein, partial [Ignavibacteriaceae bacterium]|nr:agmatine deiminase family protein [Ignavibacteriaceae bacterium]